MGIANRLKQRALKFSQKTMERLFADEKRAQRVVGVLGKAQQTKKAIDSTQRALMHQFNFATRQDYKDLGRQLSKLKKRLVSLGTKVAQL